jgi:hypothetical protein
MPRKTLVIGHEKKQEKEEYSSQIIFIINLMIFID